MHGTVLLNYSCDLILHRLTILHKVVTGTDNSLVTVQWWTGSQISLDECQLGHSRVTPISSQQAYEQCT